MAILVVQTMYCALDGCRWNKSHHNHHLLQAVRSTVRHLWSYAPRMVSSIGSSWAPPYQDLHSLQDIKVKLCKQEIQKARIVNTHRKNARSKRPFLSSAASAVATFSFALIAAPSSWQGYRQDGLLESLAKTRITSLQCLVSRLYRLFACDLSPPKTRTAWIRNLM